MTKKAAAVTTVMPAVNGASSRLRKPRMKKKVDTGREDSLPGAGGASLVVRPGRPA